VHRNWFAREAAAGDEAASQERLNLLTEMTLFQVTQRVIDLGKILVERGALPAKAGADALHISIAAVENVQYLLTWNCRHLANVTMRPLIESVYMENGFKAPLICTPEELTEVEQ
jgi:hypothetical protein